MDAIDKINAVLRAAEYEQVNLMPTRELHLRAVKHFADLAEEITYVLWNDLLDRDGCANLDPHRYPYLVRALDQVLRRHVGSCEACVDPRRCDPWARTGGGAPTYAQRPPVCQNHAERIVQEAGTRLKQLLAEVEKETCEFLAKHEPPFDNPLTDSLKENIHRALEESVKPNLIRNIASSCCDECERSVTASTRRFVS